MDVKLTATIDISERVERVANRLLDALTRSGESAGPAPARNRPAEAAQAPSGRVEAPQGTTPRQAEKKTVQGEFERMKAESPDVARLGAALELEPEEVTDEALRAALDACRRRLLGADPRRSPRYSELTGFIRNLTADTYGAAVPREIEQGRRQFFLRDLESITLVDGVGFGLPAERKLPF